MRIVCSHLDQIRVSTTDKRGCEECLKMGDSWVHLRLCMECGHVGCCDSSKNKHATKHFHRTKHPAGPVDRAGRKLDLVLRGPGSGG